MAPSGSLIHALIRHLWPRNSMARLLGELGILFVLLPRILWCWVLGVFCARFPPRASGGQRPNYILDHSGPCIIHTSAILSFHKA
jgi:hypothetical protein